MTSMGNGHLTDKLLLFYVDGELASGESARVRRHLEACWTCRAKLEDLQVAIKSIVDFRDKVLLPMVPAPPRHWDGLDPRMQELDKALQKPSVANSLSRLLRSIVLAPRYAVFAVLVLAALGALVWLPSQPAISANELLTRAQAAQSAELRKVTAPVLHQRLRVRRRVAGSTEQASTDYDYWEDPSRGRFRQTGSSAEVLAELRAICNANQLDWQAPLSAAGYARWRDSLAARQDIVAPAKVSTDRGVNDGPESLTLTTIARGQAANSLRSEDSGADSIAKAELVVRTADWHPVEERLWVNDREYEIAELDYRVLPLSEVEALVFAEPPAPVERVEAPRPVLTERTERLVPPPPDPEETEMAVRYGLHQLDADLGEPIEINRDSQGKVIVEASSVGPELQAKLRQQLASIPNAGLVLERPPSPTCDTCPLPSQEMAEMTPSPPLAFAPVVNPNEKRLEEIFGDPHAQESFTREVLAVSEETLSHCFALRNLALRYPPEDEGKLTLMARAQLKEMVNDHIAALVEGTNHLQGLLRPLLEALSNRSVPGFDTPQAAAEVTPADEVGGSVGKGPKADLSPDSGSQWQNASFTIFAAVQKANFLLISLLPNTNNPLPADQAVPQLRQALSEQQKALNKYQDLTRRDDNE